MIFARVVQVIDMQSADEESLMTDESSYISIQIPDESKVELMKALPSYSVTLVGLRHNNVLHCGSGTLVRVRDQHFILMAAHCYTGGLAKCDEIGLPIRPDRLPFKLPIKLHNLSVREPIYIGEQKSEEWGPDLAFLPINPVEANNITSISNRLFYDLEKHNEEMLKDEPKINQGLWVIVGTPAFKNNLEDSENLEFTHMRYSVVVESRIIKDEFDYLEIRVPLDHKDIPPNFQGLSGGGLWQIEIRQQEDGSLIPIGKPKLEGCAFYETPPQGDYVYICCQGRQSIYKQGLAKLIGA